MALVAGVNIPDNIRVEYSLRRIYGIGPTLAKNITLKAGIEGNPRVKDLNDSDLARMRESVEHVHKVEGELRIEVNFDGRR